MSAQTDMSFYLFDLDDNTLFLETPIFVRNTKTGELRKISTHAFASVRTLLGKADEWKDYEQFEDTYSHFRDIPADQLQPGQKQYLIEDIATAIAQAPKLWQAPSWSMFVYACQKQRPLSFVTARGHTRDTLKEGVRVLLEAGLIENEPNYLSIYAVGNSDIKDELIDSLPEGKEKQSIIDRVAGDEDVTSALKRIAIRNTVDKALKIYGAEPEHRFGMSDDDPKNVDLIIKAMCDCKTKYLDKRFFVINTHKGEHVKLEVFPIDYPVTRRVEPDEIVG